MLGEWSRPSEPAYSVSSLTLDKDSIVLALAGGETTAKLTATIVGNPGTEAVSFLSSDDTKATVDFTSGEVTAVGGGWVKIYATIGEFIDSCSVMVFNQIHDISTGDAAIPANEYWLISGTTTANKITIAEGSSAYLKDVTIDRAGSCIETTGMGYIYLVDGTTNTMDATSATDGSAAVYVTNAGMLTINGQKNGTGKLIARGDDGGAGIGSSKDAQDNEITILGGEIEAYGGENAAGIGTGECSSAATGLVGGGGIAIKGGKVKAKGGTNAAGIGTGYANGSDPGKYPGCSAIYIDNTVISVTATKGTGAQDCIGIGANGANPAVCGDIYFGPNTDPGNRVAPAGVYSIPAADGTYTYGGLTLVKSGDTWTLTPTN